MIKLKSTEVLIKEGDYAHALYFIQSGQLLVFKIIDGKQTRIGEVGPGEIVGEMSLFDGERRSASVVAETDCEVMEIPADYLEKEMEGRPKWFQMLLKTLVDRLRKANSKVRV